MVIVVLALVNKGQVAKKMLPVFMEKFVLSPTVPINEKVP